MGQASGRNWEHTKSMFKVLFGSDVDIGDGKLRERWESLIGDAKPDEIERNSKNIRAMSGDILEHAVSLVRGKLTGNKDAAEKEFLAQIAAGIRYQAVLEEQGLKFVHFAKGDYKELDFYGKLNNAVLEADLDIDMRSAGETPTLHIYDRSLGAPSSQNTLMKIRLKVEEGGAGKISWQLEKEDYLGELIAMKPEDYESRHDDETLARVRGSHQTKKNLEADLFENNS